MPVFKGSHSGNYGIGNGKARINIESESSQLLE